MPEFGAVRPVGRTGGADVGVETGRVGVVDKSVDDEWKIRINFRRQF